MRDPREYLRLTKGNTKPSSATIIVETECNQHCKFCIWHSNDLPDSEYADRIGMHMRLPLNTFKEEVNILLDNGIKSIHLCGTGEPFLNKDIIKMLAYARKKTPHVSVMSNFSRFFTPHIKDLVKLKLDEVVTNMDSGDPKQFEEIRCGSSWETVIGNIQLFDEYRKKYNTKTKLGVWCIPMHSTINSLSKVVNTCLACGVDTLKLSYLIPIGINKLTSHDNVIKPYDWEQVRRLEYIIDYARSKGLKVVAPPLSADSGVNNCQALWNTIMINLPSSKIPESEWIGNVSLHCFLAHKGDAFSFGNILKQPFNEVWDGKKIWKMRMDQLFFGADEICQGCPNR